jgi:RHS repeat-associated protein
MRITDFLFSAADANGGTPQASVRGLSFDGNGEMSAPTSTTGADARSVQPDVTLLNGRLQTADGQPVGYNAQGSVETVPLYFRLPGQTALTREAGTLTYDPLGMLSRVERGVGADKVTVDYIRDGLGRIVQRDVVGPPARCHPGSRQYFWRGNLLYEEYELAAGAYGLTRRYVWLGSDPIVVQSAVVPGGPLSDFVPLQNLTGSFCGYAKPDGTLVETVVYGAYGTPVFRTAGGAEAPGSSIGQTLLFQGAWFDEDTGLYQMGERNLHPVLARFLQRDGRLYTVSRALFAAFNGDPRGSWILPARCRRTSRSFWTSRIRCPAWPRRPRRSTPRSPTSRPGNRARKPRCQRPDWTSPNRFSITRRS